MYLFGKIPSPYYGNSSNRQRETKVHHYFKTRRSVNAEHFKVSSSAVATTIKSYDETGSHVDRHRKGRPRVTSAAKDKFISITSPQKLQPK